MATANRVVVRWGNKKVKVLEQVKEQKMFENFFVQTAVAFVYIVK